MRTGIRRKVDDLGRVVIPAGIRRSLDIREGDVLEIHVEGDQVVLAKPVERCVFCTTERVSQRFRGRSLCQDCAVAVARLGDRVNASAAAWLPEAAGAADQPRSRWSSTAS